MNNRFECSYGHHDHHHCPPVNACEQVESKSDCEVGRVDNRLGFEREVIIAEVPLHVSVEADIELPHAANDIKNIRKNVHLTQCKAIPIPREKGEVSNELNLFIEGFVHKNIQFTESCNSIVRDFAVNIPFKCFKRIKGVNDLMISTSQKSSQVDEIREIDHDGMGSNRCSFGSFTFEAFNEPVKCRLMRAEITEMEFPHNFDCDGHFNMLTEKMSLELLVRLTQTQPVEMGHKKHPHKSC
ncbi:hypothetical protein R4Z10_10455 [Niallia sp. XMNu-256]|uniref:CsxC family protein n=1 Tax=Niallia sp. XMNu-256 TaxID=3082444 RepID=UPI0030D07770